MKPTNLWKFFLVAAVTAALFTDATTAQRADVARQPNFDIRTQNMHEDERKNGHAHVKAMLLSATSHAIPVVAGEPAFGTWQRLIFFEMDEPKDRTVTFHVIGS